MNPVIINNKSVKPHKAYKNPLMQSRNVLTNSPWEFVSLWLKKEKKHRALFFWNQAHEFSNTSSSLSIQSSPFTAVP